MGETTHLNRISEPSTVLDPPHSSPKRLTWHLATSPSSLRCLWPCQCAAPEGRVVWGQMDGVIFVARKAKQQQKPWNEKGLYHISDLDCLRFRKKNAVSFKIIQDELSFSNKTHLESIYLASLEKCCPGSWSCWSHTFAGDQKINPFFQATRMSENHELPDTPNLLEKTRRFPGECFSGVMWAGRVGPKETSRKWLHYIGLTLSISLWISVVTGSLEIQFIEPFEKQSGTCLFWEGPMIPPEVWCFKYVFGVQIPNLRRCLDV